MTTALNRRGFLGAAGAAAGACLLPARVFAQPYGITEQHRRILDVARREVQRVSPVLWRRDIVGIADFGLPSHLPRLHFANLEAGTVRSYLVTHGFGSDPDHSGALRYFSNTPGSRATSRGAYISYEWYTGKYGTSIRLGGLDTDNSNAMARAIVMHPAAYAAPAMLTRFGKLGRSDGCLAMSFADFGDALRDLSGGRLIFADRLGIA